MMIISGIIYLIKATAGKITGKEVNFQDESRKVMEKTAKGVHWMNDQWEKAKGNATGNNQLLLGNDLKQLSPIILAASKHHSPSCCKNNAAFGGKCCVKVLILS